MTHYEKMTESGIEPLIVRMAIPIIYGRIRILTAGVMISK